MNNRTDLLFIEIKALCTQKTMKMNEYTAYVLLTSLNLLIMNPILLTDFLFSFQRYF